MIKNIVFDVGNVLIEYRWKDMLTDYGFSEEEAITFGETLFHDPLWGQLDLENCPTDDIILAYQEKFPEYKKDIAWFITHGELMHVNRPRVWEQVHRLKEKGYHLYIVSNYARELFEKHTKDASFLKDMDGVVVSYMIHKAKPDQAIYEYLFETYRLKPEECIFFDDREENTDAARKLGMQAVTITSQDLLLEQLQRL